MNEKIGVNEIVFETSPETEEFYIKMGALKHGEVCSFVVKDMKIHELVYPIKK